MWFGVRAIQRVSDEVPRGSMMARVTRGITCLAALMVLAGPANSRQDNFHQAPLSGGMPPEANSLPNVNDQMRMREQKTAKQNFDAINLVRKKQIAEDSNNLVTVAMALKAEVDSTTTKKFSPTALHKVERIERVAHDVKQKMQLTVSSLPDASAQMESRDKQAKQVNFDDANAERNKQIADDSTKLLIMALALKSEVDKTTKDTLSLNVIRRAKEIEKLAHNVKEEMKLMVGPG